MVKVKVEKVVAEDTKTIESEPIDDESLNEDDIVDAIDEPSDDESTNGEPANDSPVVSGIDRQAINNEVSRFSALRNETPSDWIQTIAAHENETYIQRGSSWCHPEAHQKTEGHQKTDSEAARKCEIHQTSWTLHIAHSIFEGKCIQSERWIEQIFKTFLIFRRPVIFD